MGSKNSSSSSQVGPGTRSVAFLRGMNLGRRRVTNVELVEIFEAMGFKDVAPFLASGNVVFRSGRNTPDLENKIEAGLKSALQYNVRVFVRSEDEVRSMAACQPFSAAELGRSDGKAQVILLEAALGAAARRKILAFASDEDRLAPGKREVFWLPAGRLTDSVLDLKGIERVVGETTIRTKNTMERIAKRFLQT